MFVAALDKNVHKNLNKWILEFYSTFSSLLFSPSDLALDLES